MQQSGQILSERWPDVGYAQLVSALDKGHACMSGDIHVYVCMCGMDGLGVCEAIGYM